MYAIRIPSLTDVPGFPVPIRGCADNDPKKCFLAGIANQRPSLTTVGDFIIAGFGSHCGNYNYTGYLVSVGKKAGVGIARYGYPTSSRQPFGVLSSVCRIGRELTKG